MNSGESSSDSGGDTARSTNQTFSTLTRDSVLDSTDLDASKIPNSAQSQEERDYENPVFAHMSGRSATQLISDETSD
jgi:hypothetical protein